MYALLSKIHLRFYKNKNHDIGGFLKFLMLHRRFLYFIVFATSYVAFMPVIFG